MERTPKDGKRFSFTKFINNAVPNLAMAPQSYDITPPIQDAIFEYQLGEEDPLKLDPQAFVVASITSSKTVAAQVHRALVKNGILEQNSPVVNTNKVTKNFAHELACISSHAQKRLVNLLFFWEEEVMRFKVLKGEWEELKVVVQAEGEADAEAKVGTYEKRMREINGLLRLKPSMRSEQARQDEVLPEYPGAK
jgi:hypothetical protein